MNNTKYGKSVSNEDYLQRVKTMAQDDIDAGREDAGDDYCEDGMEMEILDWLDEINIEAEDIYDIMSSLEF